MTRPTMLTAKYNRISVIQSLREEIAHRTPGAVWGQIAIAFIIWISTELGGESHDFPPLLGLTIMIMAIMRWRISRKAPLLWFPYVYVTLIGALAWGALNLILLRNHGLVDPLSYVPVIMLAGLSASAVTTLSPSPALCITFISIVLGVPLCYFLERPFDSRMMAIPSLFVCFGGFLIHLTRVHYEEVRRRLELHREILEERNRLQTVLNTFPGIVSCIDSEMRYTFVNSGLTHANGDDPKGLIGKAVGFSGKDPEFAEAVTRFMSCDSESHSSEVDLTANDRKRAFLICMRKITGPQQGAVIVSLDVQNMKDAASQLELERARAMYSAKMALLGEMAGGIAHEINNPLAVISGYASQVRDQLRRGLLNPATIEKANTKIESMVSRISKIISGLKTFSHSEESDPMRRHALKPIIEDTLELCSERIRLSGIKLRLGEIPDVELFCSPVQISQVLLNLISNARDAVESLEEKWISLSFDQSADTLSISVTDSGKGIPEPLRDKVLVPFFTTKPVGKGTGLGLSISKGIAESHHGSLQLDATAPNTRFVLVLPLRATEQSKAEKPAA